jgi:hypothetical protein
VKLRRTVGILAGGFALAVPVLMAGPLPAGAQEPTTLDLGVSAPTVNYGSGSATFTATVLPTNDTIADEGKVTFSVTSSTPVGAAEKTSNLTLCSVTLNADSDDEASCSANENNLFSTIFPCASSRCTGGTFTVQASYTDSSGTYGPSSNTIPETVLGERYTHQTIALSPLLDPQTASSVWEPVAATVTVRAASVAGNPVPTGSVSLYDIAKTTVPLCGPLALPAAESGQTAVTVSCTFTPTLAGVTPTSGGGGVLKIGMTYTGDQTFEPLTVADPAIQRLTLDASTTPALSLTPVGQVHMVGKPLTLLVGLPKRVGNAPKPTATVSVTDPAGTERTLCVRRASLTLHVVEACHLTPKATGTFQASLAYTGDQNDAPGTVGPITFYVSGSSPDKLRLGASENPAAGAKAVTLSARVKAGGASVTGSVLFLSGTKQISCSNGPDPAPVADDVATCTTTYSPGTLGMHTRVWAYYSGDPTYSGSSKNFLLYVDGSGLPGMTATASAGTIVRGSPEVITATVTGSTSGATYEPAPTGSVTFQAPGVASQTVKLVAGPAGSDKASASWRTGTLPVATAGETITATYSGDRVYRHASTTTTVIVRRRH